MNAAVNLDDLLNAFEWVNAGPPLENAAYISRASGRIHWALDTEEYGVEPGEELPDDVADEALYLRVPHKSDLDLGQALVFRFVRQHLPDAYGQVEEIFQRKGAYGRYRNLLERLGRVGAWYDFETAATEAALKEWAAENDVHVTERPRAGS